MTTIRKSRRTIVASVLALFLMAGTVACTAPPTPEPMKTSVSSEAENTPAPAPPKTEEVPQADPGTRENPLPVGQVIAFRPGSAFQVGAAGPTLTTPTYSVLPVVVQVDWESVKTQFPNESAPTVDIYNFNISFVSAGGKSYTMMEDYSIQIENDWYMLAPIYEGTATLSGNFAVSVPADEVPGGAWVIENFSSTDKVFVAVQ